jgi:dTDP-4-dehydrorhamnose reductase
MTTSREPLTILLTGPTGQVGRALRARLAAPLRVIALDRLALDLARDGAIADAVVAARPDVVINAAGFTAVDAAESEEPLARRLNAEAPGHLARGARRCGAVLVHYSTDYVFDGRSDRPYEPDDATAPLGVYGRTKLDGEHAVRESGVQALVLRTSWVYAARGRNFLRTMLALANRRPEIRVVDDQVGSPTAAHVVAEATLEAIETALEGRHGARGFGGREGTYHVACAGRTTWYGFARAIFELEGRQPPPRLVPIATADYPTAAKRPMFSVLSSARFEAAFDTTIPDWRSALHRVMDEVARAEADRSREARP